VQKRLGEILVEMGALEAELLAQCLNAQQRQGGRIGQLLVQMHVLPEVTVLEALSAQLELPVAPLDRVDIPSEVLGILSRTACKQHGVLPFAMHGPYVHTAMIDPSQRDAADALRQITRKVVRPYITGPEALDRAIRRHFDETEALVVDFTMVRDATVSDRRPSRPPRFEAISVEGPVLKHVVAEGPGGTPLEATPAPVVEAAVPRSLRPTDPPPVTPLLRAPVPPPLPSSLRPTPPPASHEVFEGPDFDTPIAGTQLGCPLPSPSPYDAPTQLAENPFSGPPTRPGMAPIGNGEPPAGMAAQLQALEARVLMLTTELAEVHTRVMELERSCAVDPDQRRK